MARTRTRSLPGCATDPRTAGWPDDMRHKEMEYGCKACKTVYARLRRQGKMLEHMKGKWCECCGEADPQMLTQKASHVYCLSCATYWTLGRVFMCSHMTGVYPRKRGLAEPKQWDEIEYEESYDSDGD